LDNFNNIHKNAPAQSMSYQRPPVMLLPNYGGVAYDTSGNGTQTPVVGSNEPTNDQCAGYSLLTSFSCQ
jgi:hypothetical protein